MNTQTFAQVQDFTAITDEELMAVNGGNIRTDWLMANNPDRDRQNRTPRRPHIPGFWT